MARASGPLLITDPDLAAEVRARVAREQPDRVTEVWDGVEVMSPLARIDHQDIASWLVTIYTGMIDRRRGERCYAGINVTDQPKARWKKNYRCPDVVVVRDGCPAIHRGSHMCGGPDVVVEVLSPSEDPTQKFAFYANVAVRELMVVDLREQSIELFQPQNGVMTMISKTDATGGVAQSTVLPVEFSYAGGTLVATHTGTGQTWTF
ncbi:MAG: Uma2 family endonuclease [Gemmataceae bacterium]